MSVPTVFVPKNILSLLADPVWFPKYIVGNYFSVSDHFGLQIKIAAAGLLEAHSQWSGDIERIKQFELKGGTPDHFKQSGHLIYWLRRTAPVYEFNLNQSYPPAGTPDDIRRVNDGRDLIMKYGNEYLAFSLGYNICLLHCVQDEEEAKKFSLDKNYLETVCQFLRNKNVSPHALFLILRSLFHRPKA